MFEAWSAVGTAMSGELSKCDHLWVTWCVESIWSVISFHLICREYSERDQLSCDAWRVFWALSAITWCVESIRRVISYHVMCGEYSERYQLLCDVWRVFGALLAITWCVERIRSVIRYHVMCGEYSERDELMITWCVESIRSVISSWSRDVWRVFGAWLSCGLRRIPI